MMTESAPFAVDLRDRKAGLGADDSVGLDHSQQLSELFF
jgi:hypothetical protein